jgi:hypothetical protein
MKRIAIVILLAALVGPGAIAAADPALEVRYPGGVPRLLLSGDFANATYTVWRSAEPEGARTLVGAEGVLCLESCYADDPTAAPGATYWYRFDLVLADGTPARFGPYRVTLSSEQMRRVGIRVSPNPGRGATAVELTLAAASGGGSVAAEAVLFDLQGRKVATVYRGALAPGLTRTTWNGRDDWGAEIRAGSYFLRVTAGAHSAVHRVTRIR